jgi:hypothetical protein
MANIPCIFSFGALSLGTVLPTLGHENYLSSIRVVSEERRDREDPLCGPAPARAAPARR